jgi:hypothetical protein
MQILRLGEREKKGRKENLLLPNRHVHTIPLEETPLDNDKDTMISIF